MGLITSRQGRPSRVAPHESWNQFAPAVLAARQETGAVDDILLELLELRRMVELEAAGLAAERRSNEDVERLKSSLTLLDASLSGPEMQNFIEHDLAFHAEILRSTKNHLLPQLFEQLRPLLEFGREISMKTRSDAHRLSQEGHRRIFRAIATGDAPAARAAMTEHLSWTADLDYAQRQARFDRESAR